MPGLTPHHRFRMTLKEALAVLAANDVAADGTFLYWLHERRRFDVSSLWRLDAAMQVIAAAPPKSRGRMTGRRAFHVYQYILKSVVFHLNPHDLCVIRGVPRRKLYDYLDRLEWVFDPVINRRPGYGPWLELNDGLEKQRQAALRRGVRP
jgi:hypothetical protein